MGQNFYKRDDRDVKFVLKEHLGIDQLLELEPYQGFTMEDFDMILDQAQKIAANDVAPSFQDGDRQGCRFDQGRVLVPESFKHAWKVFQEGSWFALAMKPDFGGQGLPLIVAEAAMEFFISANFAFGCFAGLGPGNGAMIENFGSPEQKDLFCAKMYDGTWGGSMCLTEPAVGSDAHLVAVKASPDGEYYKIQGTKIFITSGEHDLAENIVHLVIARIEGAPAGAKGVSLFAVPKIWVNGDGTLGEPNDVACIGIEHKMGLHGSATCVLNFGENGQCRGHLIGEAGKGLAYMFQMVNVARMAVGLESVAFGANIYANARDYAKERVQGTRFAMGGERIRIVEHADIRRMLLNLKSLTEGMRALVYKTYLMEDLSRNSPDPDRRRKAKGRLELFTPLVKAYCSDRIFEMGRDGIQVLGGYGFTKEYPIEQYTRDCKILSIWDGTNFIQSADLVGRKLNMGGGAVFQAWAEEVAMFIKDHEKDRTFGKELEILKEALETVAGLVLDYGRYFGEGKLDLIPLTSTRFLDCMSEVAVAHLLLEQGMIAQTRLEGGDAGAEGDFYRGKVAAVQYYCRNFLPQVFGRARIIKMEDLTAVQVEEAAL
ncbi:MAG: acyl-CoA dehydrogenase [Syntrophales bacterium]